MTETTLRIPSTDGVLLDARLTRADGTPKGRIVLVHGIASEKEEGGLYTRLAAALAEAMFDSLRFDFRGHGLSSGSSVDMTIRGETEDLRAAVACAKEQGDAPIGILAASFGTVSSLNFLQEHETDIRALVLWNPVLDLQHTFTRPQMPWGKALFSEEKRAEMERTGILSIGRPYGRALIEEMDAYFPYRVLQGLSLPVLTIHGDRDEITSHALSMQYGAPNGRSETLTLPGVGHGFGEKGAQAIDASVQWFSKWMEQTKTTG